MDGEDIKERVDDLEYKRYDRELLVLAEDTVFPREVQEHLKTIEQKFTSTPSREDLNGTATFQSAYLSLGELERELQRMRGVQDTNSTPDTNSSIPEDPCEVEDSVPDTNSTKDV